MPAVAAGICLQILVPASVRFGLLMCFFLASQLRLPKCRARCAPGPSPLVLRHGARQQSLHAAVGGHTQSKTSANSTSEHHDFRLMPS